MRKSITILVAILIVITSLTVSFNARETNVYFCPLTKEIPQINGKITEEAWIKALTIELDAPATTTNNGWALYPSNKDTAKGTIKVLWSDDKEHGGLYFAAEIADKTQSFALDRNTSAPNAMDCIQLVIDPLYQRRAKMKESAMIYTFLPYTSRSGNGFAIYPEDGALWYEHVYWVGRNESLGIKVASSLDIISEDEERRWLVSGYSIEAYLPWEALTVLAGKPEAKVGTKMGIGFLLVDYDFEIKEGFLENIPEHQKLINVTADYSNGTRTTRENICAYPRNYNTMVLTDEDGTIFDVEKPDDSHTTPDVNANKEESLRELLEKDDALNAADYTYESWASYLKARAAALKYKDDESSPEAKKAKDELVAAINGLQLLYTIDNIQEQTDVNLRMAKLTELINSTKNLSKRYSEEQLKDVNDLIDYAEKLLSTSTASTQELEEVYQNLIQEIDNLPLLESHAPQVEGLQDQSIFLLITVSILIIVILVLIIMFAQRPLKKKKQNK